MHNDDKLSCRVEVGKSPVLSERGRKNINALRDIFMLNLKQWRNKFYLRRFVFYKYS